MNEKNDWWYSPCIEVSHQNFEHHLMADSGKPSTKTEKLMLTFICVSYLIRHTKFGYKPFHKYWYLFQQCLSKRPVNIRLGGLKCVIVKRYIMDNIEKCPREVIVL
jgi:hypothetical protein